MAADLESFISRWSSGDGGQERANYALFLSELCDVLEVPRPDQASYDAAQNAYAFERAVTFREPDGSTARGRIDLYRRGSFVLEAKQSRRPGTAKAVPQQGALAGLEQPETAPRGKRAASRGWDVLMLNARQQAEDYAKALPASEGWPPFLIVCDVGHCFEIYADFTGQGKNYAQFPDRKGFRIYLEELRQESIRERLRLIWLEPHRLDPTKIAAKATREVAERLAKVSKHLEEAKAQDGGKLYDPELSFQEPRGAAAAARRNRRAVRGGEGRLETGRACHFRHITRTGFEPGGAAQAWRALYAAHLCRTACARDPA